MENFVMKKRLATGFLCAGALSALTPCKLAMVLLFTAAFTALAGCAGGTAEYEYYSDYGSFEGHEIYPGEANETSVFTDGGFALEDRESGIAVLSSTEYPDTEIALYGADSHPLEADDAGIYYSYSIMEGDKDMPYEIHGLHFGATEDEIIAEFGWPDMVMEEAGSTLLLYNTSPGISFTLDGEGGRLTGVNVTKIAE